jgi:predicted phage baseplate assembly protein
VRATYRTGGGTRGNRAAGEIAQLKTALPGVDSASNPLAAVGGSDAEPIDAVRDRGPRGLRHRGRAVAPSDYEDIVREEVPAVVRALAVPATGSQDAGTVGVVVVGTALAPGPELLAAAEAAIEVRAPATAAIWVSGPGWSEIAVSAGLAPVTPDAAGDVPAAAVAALDAFLDPLTGGAKAAGWPFGRGPHDSELVALLERLPGVDHVAWLSVTRTDTDAPPSPGAFLVVPGRHAITLVGS